MSLSRSKQLNRSCFDKFSMNSLFEQHWAYKRNGQALDTRMSMESTSTGALPMVELDQVEKWFGHTAALTGVTLTVASGDFLVLLGRNGAGKSTLLRVIARLTKPNSGTVRVAGADIRRSPEKVRQSLGFVAHSSYLYRNLTARENLRFFGRMYRLENLEEQVRQALGWVGLSESADRRVMGFSRGMQQRLTIARATLHAPDLLLMDEPFSGLDLEASELLAGWMQEFVGRGKTIIMATHDLEHGLRLVNRWVFVDRGRIAEELSGDYAVVREQYRKFLRERRSAFS
jgi:heme exporter protein A